MNCLFVVQALHRASYSGRAMVEVSPYRVHPEQALVNSARDRLLAE